MFSSSLHGARLPPLRGCRGRARGADSVLLLLAPVYQVGGLTMDTVRRRSCPPHIL